MKVDLWTGREVEPGPRGEPVPRFQDAGQGGQDSSAPGRRKKKKEKIVHNGGLPGGSLGGAGHPSEAIRSGRLCSTRSKTKRAKGPEHPIVTMPSLASNGQVSGPSRQKVGLGRALKKEVRKRNN